MNSEQLAKINELLAAGVKQTDLPDHFDIGSYSTLVQRLAKVGYMIAPQLVRLQVVPLGTTPVIVAPKDIAPIATFFTVDDLANINKQLAEGIKQTELPDLYKIGSYNTFLQRLARDGYRIAPQLVCLSPGLAMATPFSSTTPASQ